MMIKKTTAVFYLMMGMMLASTVNAQTSTFNKSIVKDLSKTTSFALGAQSEKHIKAGFKIYEQMLESGVQIDNFEIIVWGNVVKELKAGTDLADFISAHQSNAVKVSVCEVAMNRMEVSDTDLVKGAKSVPNAFVRIYQLQALGYNTLIP